MLRNPSNKGSQLYVVLQMGRWNNSQQYFRFIGKYIAHHIDRGTREDENYIHVWL